jgi:hypothetical protein
MLLSINSKSPQNYIFRGYSLEKTSSCDHTHENIGDVDT